MSVSMSHYGAHDRHTTTTTRTLALGRCVYHTGLRGLRSITRSRVGHHLSGRVRGCNRSDHIARSLG